MGAFKRLLEEFAEFKYPVKAKYNIEVKNSIYALQGSVIRKIMSGSKQLRSEFLKWFERRRKCTKR